MGTIGDWLHIEPFYMIALANGACAAFYLYAVYCFLMLVVPRLAGRAFLLFSLGGGLGGLLYVLTGPWHSHPDFGVYFQRYFMYELNEGARFQPWLMAARLYYTLPFGLAFLGLAAFWRRLNRAAAPTASSPPCCLQGQPSSTCASAPCSGWCWCSSPVVIPSRPGGGASRGRAWRSLERESDSARPRG